MVKFSTPWVEIVRQTGNQDFAQLVHSMSEGKQTDKGHYDKALANNTNSFSWPKDFAKLRIIIT